MPHAGAETFSASRTVTIAIAVALSLGLLLELGQCDCFGRRHFIDATSA